jgi:hypothetical protein
VQSRRAWLNSIFAAAQEEKRDAILKKLREAQTSFRPVEQYALLQPANILNSFKLTRIACLVVADLKS